MNASSSNKAHLIAGEKSKPLHADKIDRNAQCACGSGKKAKDCCGANTKYYNRIRKE